MCSAPLFRFSDLYEISIHLAERQSRGRLGYGVLHTVRYCTTLDVGFCAEDETKMALGYHDFLFSSTYQSACIGICIKIKLSLLYAIFKSNFGHPLNPRKYT
jgi:hypothetical protein